MSATTGPRVLAADKSVIVQEGDMLRNRVPSVIVSALGAQSNKDAIDWQVQEFPGGQKLAIGRLILNGREEVVHTPPAAKKAAAKKAAAPAVPQVPAPPQPSNAIWGSSPVPVPLAAPAVEEEDDEEDEGEVSFSAPAAPIPGFPPLTGYNVGPAGPTPFPVPQAAPPAPAAGKKSAKKGGARKGGGKGSKKQGGVAYQVPGQVAVPTVPQVPGLANLFK